MARLSDSVAPEVKTISLSDAPISAATCLRAFSTAASAFQPNDVVAGRGVAEVLREVRQHRLEHARVERRGGVVVHVDRQLHETFVPGGMWTSQVHIDRNGSADVGRAASTAGMGWLGST